MLARRSESNTLNMIFQLTANNIVLLALFILSLLVLPRGTQSFSDILKKTSIRQRKELCKAKTITSLSMVTSRRSMLMNTAPFFFTIDNIFHPSTVYAEDDVEGNNPLPENSGININIPSTIATTTKPYANLQNLLPAARVKFLIDQAVMLSSRITNIDVNTNVNNKAEKLDLVQKLNYLLLTKAQVDYFLNGYDIPNIPTAPAKQYLDSYKANRDQLSIIEKPGAILFQNGEINAWKRLKRQEREREVQDITGIRAALNVYTTGLAFNADSYILNNVSKSDRSRMIRDNKLPDVKQVIASDMGMRYLYRNQILTSIDDAKAELVYQLNKIPGKEEDDFDSNEIFNSLVEAQVACNKWFALIDENDVYEAMSIVKNEEAEQKVIKPN